MEEPDKMNGYRFFRAVLTLQSDQEDGLETLSSHMHIDSPINNIIHRMVNFFHQG